MNLLRRRREGLAEQLEDCRAERDRLVETVSRLESARLDALRVLERDRRQLVWRVQEARKILKGAAS